MTETIDIDSKSNTRKLPDIYFAAPKELKDRRLRRSDIHKQAYNETSKTFSLKYDFRKEAGVAVARIIRATRSFHSLHDDECRHLTK